MPDGSFLVVEVAGGTLTRVSADGNLTVIADLGGGPNGAAMGPDGAVYITNNGGVEFEIRGDETHLQFSRTEKPPGGIDRVDLDTGEFRRIYASCDGKKLAAPNDLVFDSVGGFYFTDTGKIRSQNMDHGFIYYATIDGSSITQLDRLITPNGVGLSKDERTLYVAESLTGRLWAYDIVAPGKIRKDDRLLSAGGRLVATLPDAQIGDSLAIDSEGHICLGSLPKGAIFRISPDGQRMTRYSMPDSFATNICFGGPDLRTAYVTLTTTGRLVAIDWPVPGLAPNFRDR
jgi:gluconolactonase